MRLEARLFEILVAAISPLFLIQASRAASTATSTAPPPVAPVTISRKISKPNYPCYREFLYRGESIGCDSTLGPDGEGLRPVVSQVPESVAALDQYQRERRGLRTFAYTGTAGLLLLIATQYAVSRISVGDTRTLVHTLGTVVGAGLIAGSLAWGFVVVYRSESKLEEIIRIYNTSRPDDPILLQFSTKVRF